MNETPTNTHRPARQYRWSRAHDLDAVLALSGELEALFEGLVSGRLPGPGYQLDDLVAFARSAVARQRGDDRFARAGSWAVTPDGEDMPKDARHDFIMRTTWYVVAILTWLRQHHPAAAAGVAGLDRAIQRGLDYGLMNGLVGPGYYGGDATLEALRLFEQSGLTGLVEQDPAFRPELPVLLREHKRRYAEALPTAGDDGAFGAITRADCVEALRWLSALEDA
ncbi:MAG: hypothetical protein NDI82_01785 [Anaeromyxobacteraceae bacterium]|nr:hypothetical protein [Anaeromyxobacteraceae bacterium]